jgi:hypothetical protein
VLFASAGAGCSGLVMIWVGGCTDGGDETLEMLMGSGSLRSFLDSSLNLIRQLGRRNPTAHESNR